MSSTAAASSQTIHYCFIARDSDMIVFESILNKDLSAQPQAQRTAFRREIKERLLELDTQITQNDSGDTESGSNFALKTIEGGGQDGSAAKVATYSHFARSFLPGDLKLTILNNIVYIGCVTDASLTEERTTRLLGDLRNEFSKMYQGRLSLIRKQTNLTANVYD